MNEGGVPVFDVAVIGAGPAGSSSAALLARGGVRVLLVDKAGFPRDKICGDCINPRCWDFLHLLGVADDVRGQAEVIQGVGIAGRRGTLIEIPLTRETTGNSPVSTSRRPFIAMKRSTLDSLFLHRAISDGATYWGRTALESIAPHRSSEGGWVIACRRDESIERRHATCRYLIGADGRNSRVASLISKSEGTTRNHGDTGPGRIGIQFFIHRPLLLRSNLLLFFFEGGYGGIVGVNSDEANVAMVVTRELARLATNDFSQFVAKTIHSNSHAKSIAPGTDKIGDIHAAHPISPRANIIHHSSLYLVGDARHTAEPFTGEGIFFALQDGARAARRILRELGVAQEQRLPPRKSRLFVDHIFSPIVRRGSAAEKFVHAGACSRTLSRIVTRTVLAR